MYEFDILKKFNDTTGNIRLLKRKLTESSLQVLKECKPFDSAKLRKAPIQVMDFFCGCGGMSLGFAAVSQLHPFFNLVGGCDIDIDATATYTNNLGVPALNFDISIMAKDDKVLGEYLKLLPQYDKKKPLVLIGCAPCQGFSSHRKKNWSSDDERNTLITAFASIATKLNPACIIMENVPEMLSHKYWHHFESVRNILQKADYIVRQNVYNAADFGVPQERFRAIVMAMKKDFLLPDPLLDHSKYLTVRHAIGELPEVKPGEVCPDDDMHRCANHRKSTIEIIRNVPRNGGNRPTGLGPKCLDKIDGFYDVYGRLFWDYPAITITHYARNPASGRFTHPEQDRGLTAREAALLQSFPNGYSFSGSFDSIFKQIGEAVPPKMACAIAANVLVEILAEPPTENEKINSFPSISNPVSNSFSGVIAGLKTKRRAKKCATLA